MAEFIFTFSGWDASAGARPLASSVLRPALRTTGQEANQFTSPRQFSILFLLFIGYGDLRYAERLPNRFGGHQMQNKRN